MEAFSALRDKMYEGRTQLKQLNIQQRAKERTVKECNLVTDQLQPLPPDVRTYKSIGRAYLLASKDEISLALKEKLEKNEKEIETLKAGQSKLESELKEIEQNMQELLQTSPELAQITQAASS